MMSDSEFARKAWMDRAKMAAMDLEYAAQSSMEDDKCSVDTPGRIRSIALLILDLIDLEQKK